MIDIDCCYCFDREFAELKDLAARYSVSSIEELKKKTKFGTNCKICIPYIRRMLRTGETCFNEIIKDDK